MAVVMVLTVHRLEEEMALLTAAVVAAAAERIMELATVLQTEEMVARER